mgnify:FL=1
MICAARVALAGHFLGMLLMAKTPTADKLQPTGMLGVYVVATVDFARYAADGRINQRPIRAWAPHPDHDDLVYLTTEHPETLAFLPDPYVEVD